VKNNLLFLRFNRLFYTWSFEKVFEKLKLVDFTSQSQINRLNRGFNRLFFLKNISDFVLTVKTILA